MTQEQKTEIAVGVTTVAALVILVLAVIWGKGYDIFAPRTHLYIRFEDVRGIQKGDQVVVRGIQQGAIESIALTPNSAEVRIWLKEGVKLYSDFQARIEAKDLTGGKQLSIDPGGNGKLLASGDHVVGQASSDPMQIMSSAGKTFAKVDTIIDLIKAFLARDEMSHAIGDVRETLNLAKAMLAENRKSLLATTSRLDSLTLSLQRDSTASRIHLTVQRLDSTTQAVHALIAKINSGEGTLGKLIQDRALYDKLMTATLNLDSLAVDIKRNPKRYVHMSLF